MRGRGAVTAQKPRRGKGRNRHSDDILYHHGNLATLCAPHLALAANRLGAAEVLGIDIDASSVPVAEANARANHAQVRFEAIGFEPERLPGPFGVVVANLYAELHQRFVAGYRAVLEPAGDLLITGILHPREASLRQLPGFALVAEVHEESWVLLHHRRSG